MAEITKQKKKQKYELYEDEKNNQKKKTTAKNINQEEKNKESKRGLWASFMNFCHGVKLETQKVRWTSKADMIKYSVATISFILFCSIFFYGIDTVFALVQSVFK